MISLTNMSLAKKTALLTCLGLILAMAVFAFLSVKAVNQATENMLQDRLTTARVVGDYVDEAMARAVAELRATAASVNGADSRPEAEVRVLQDTYRRLSISVQGVYLANQHGKVVWSQPSLPPTAASDLSFYSSVSQAAKAAKATISELVRAPANDRPVVLLSSPTMDGPGGPAVLIVAIDPGQSSIGGFVRPIRLGNTGYVEIVDRNGVVVVRTEPGRALSPFEKSDHSERFAALISDGKPTQGLCHTCHEPVQKVESRDVLAFVPLSGAHWGVAIRQSEEEALAPINQLRQDLVLFAAGLLAAALLIVAITTRDLVGRIRMLTAASRKIAGGDLLSPVVSSRQDEIGLLARSFEDMRVNLKTSRDELERRTRELSSLLSVSEILTSLPDLSNLDTALADALDRILDIMKEDTGSIFLLDERGMLCCRAQRGLPREHAEACFRPGEGATGRVAQSGQTTVVADTGLDDGHPESNYLGIGGDGVRAFASVPLRSKGQVLGVLNVASHQSRKFTPEDVRLLEDIAGQIATAIENARLHQAVQREDETRGELLREILSIQEEERQRIARELHDETSQVLASLNANLQAMSEMLPANTNVINDRLKQAQALSISVLDDIHRLIYELRPTLLDDLGLVAAVRWLGDNNLRSAGIKVNFKTVGRAKRLSPQVEVTLFRVIQEALNNIARHAKAAKADISLHFRKAVIGVHIKDDGIGFDVEEAITSKQRPRGLGLLGMKERVELVNGRLDIDSRPNGGTELNIEIPLDEEVTNGQDKDSDSG